jgi:hypothetical protein
MRALCVAVVVVLSAVAATPQAQTGGLTPAAIVKAIAFGESQELRPYLLRHQGRLDNPVVVGAVYTPFLRVALLAKAAAERGERLAPADVEARWTEPLVYIAFRWYCCDGNPATGEADAWRSVEPQVLMLPIAERAPEFVRFTKDARQGAVRPVWARRGAALVEAFGGQVPYDDIVLVAAFPAGSIQAGRPFVIYKERADGDYRRTGVVRPADVLAWR